MRYTLFLLAGIVLSIHSVFAGNFSVSGIGNYYEKTSEIPGIEVLYIFNGLSDVQLIYTSDNPNITITKYGLDGVESDADVTPSPSGYTIFNLQDSYGYVAESKVVWIVDYSKHGSNLRSVVPETPVNEEERCVDKAVLLNIDYNEIPIHYLSISGNRFTLDRKYQIEYNTLEYISKSRTFVDEKINSLQNISRETQVTAPLVATTFSVTDPIAEALGLPASITSEIYQPAVVEAHLEYTVIVNGFETEAETETEGETEAGEDPTGIDSAPKEIRFYAYANTPVAYYYEWYIYKNDPGRVNYLLKRENETDFTYTFTEAGKYEVVLMVSSADDLYCIAEKTQKFDISESSLEIPNFFSPGTSAGFNDEFKVKYKSIVKFKATIFNRWGNKIYEWTDPEQGWDGKYKGKYVNPGVYFYVIEATGSEGKKYKKGGDINIVRGK